jgi:hypothetical protein
MRIESANEAPIVYRESPDMRLSKLCRACGVPKPTSDFYTINDYAAIGMKSYPSARCKPCHNALRTHNRRERRARLMCGGSV